MTSKWGTSSDPQHGAKHQLADGKHTHTHKKTCGAAAEEQNAILVITGTRKEKGEEEWGGRWSEISGTRKGKKWMSRMHTGCCVSTPTFYWARLNAALYDRTACLGVCVVFFFYFAVDIENDVPPVPLWPTTVNYLNSHYAKFLRTKYEAKLSSTSLESPEGPRILRQFKIPIILLTLTL